ncbi:MAG: terminase small subunit, partial [Rhodospirillaceae bacterium]|nr:terminase small subunit [Rhodospirillaceae bacterium]
MTAPLSPATPDSLPGAVPDAAPDAAPEAHPPDAAVPESPLTQRQEDFCRHYAATGNAAGAARDAGYAAGSARQTGHELLERTAVADRVRAIRAAWRTVERAEAQILLGRLEQAWDAAVEKGSAALMIRVVKLQAELSGLDRRHAHRRAGLWPLPGEEAGEEAGDGIRDGTEGPPEGPIAEAVRRGRHRTERALAAHRARRRALERRKDFDEAAWLATAQRLHATVEERRPRRPDRQAGRPAPAMTNPDNSLHGSLHASANPAADAPIPDSVRDSAPGGPTPADPDISLHRSLPAPADGAGPEAPVPTEPDISLHGSLHGSLGRAGLLPAETAGGVPASGAPALDGPAWFADHHAEIARIQAEGRPFTDLEMLAHRTSVDRYAAKLRVRNARFPDSIQGVKYPGCAGFPQPAGEPGPEERRAEAEERAFLRTLARTRPPYVTGIAGRYLHAFAYDRPCRGAREAAHTDGEHD